VAAGSGRRMPARKNLDSKAEKIINNPFGHPISGVLSLKRWPVFWKKFLAAEETFGDG
jgi:hypothetical protein